MKKMYLLFTAFSIILMGVGSMGCSSGNEDFAIDVPSNDSINKQYQSDCKGKESVEANVVIDSIVGNWLLVKEGGRDVNYKKKVLTFFPEGAVAFAVANGENSEEEQKSKSSFVLENDWAFLDGTILTGHIQFSFYDEDKFDRFICSVVNGQMVLLPDMGYRYFKDPTMYFVRVKQ